MGGFWQAAADDQKQRGINGTNQGDNIAGFFTKSLPSFASGVADSVAGGAVRAGADIANGIATGFNQDETDKRTNDFMQTAGFKKDGSSNMSIDSDPNARAVGSVTGAIANLPAGIVDATIQGAGHVGNTLGTAAATALGITDATAKSSRDEIDSINKMRQDLLNHGADGKGPLAPGSNTVDDLSDAGKKQFADLTNKIQELQTKQATDSKQNQDALDPVKFAANAVNTALAITGLGAAAKVASGAGKVAEGVDQAAQTGLSIAKPGVVSKVTDALNAGPLGTAARAFTNPDNAVQGMAAYGTAGAVQGGVNSAADGGNGTDIAYNSILGGLGGAAAGAVGGFMGGKTAAAEDAATAAANARPGNAQPIGTQSQDAALTASVNKVVAEAPKVTPEAAPTQVVNGDGKGSSSVPNQDPFHPENPIGGTNTQAGPQDASFPTSPGGDKLDNPNSIALNNQQMSLSELGKAAEAQNPSSFIPKKGAKTIQDVKTPDSMAASVTPGQTTVLQGEINLTPEEKAAAALHGNGNSGITTKPMQVNDGYQAAKDEATAPAVQTGPLENALTEGIHNTNDTTLPQNVQEAAQAIGNSTGTLGAEYKSAPTQGQKVLGSLTNNLDNVTNNTSRMAGKVGADFADKMQTGANTKEAFIADTSHNVDNIEKYAKDNNLTVTQQKESTARVADAIAKDDTSKLQPEDQTLYDNIKSLWDKSKDLRIKQGRAVKDNYVTHVNIDGDSNKSGQIADALFNKDNPDMLSMFSKKQSDNSQAVDNLYSVARKYQQGMANDLGYHDAQQFLSANLDKIPASLANDPKNMSEFKNYVSDLFDHAINGSSETAASKAVAKYAVNPFTDNVLRFNIGNSLKNYTDQIRTASNLTPEAKKISVDGDILKEFTGKDGGLNFDYGATNSKTDPTLELTRKSKFGEFMDKISPNMITEGHQVQANAQKGLQQGFHMSDVYQQAKASGMSDAEAQKFAWANDKEGIQRTANYIAGTSSAGNAMQQVAAVRNGKPILGIIPWSAMTRFASYPINNTMSFVRNMNPTTARAIEAYARGDVMGSKMADIRGNANTLLDMYTNAAKQGDTSIPKDVLDTKIQTIKKAISTIDDELAKGSQISRGNTAMTYAKIWGATTAIQMAVVGTQDAMFNRTGSQAKQKSVGGTILGQNPFLDINRVLSPMVNGSPIQSDGKGGWGLNARGIVNAVPYAGGVDNATGNNLSSWLNTNVVKGTNTDIKNAYK